MPNIARIELVGRRPLPGLLDARIASHVVDLMSPSAYRPYLVGIAAAVCTLGVGQPSGGGTKEEFLRIDRDIPLKFAAEAWSAGVRHFTLPVPIQALGFERLPLVHPS